MIVYKKTGTEEEQDENKNRTEQQEQEEETKKRKRTDARIEGSFIVVEVCPPWYHKKVGLAPLRFLTCADWSCLRLAHHWWSPAAAVTFMRVTGPAMSLISFSSIGVQA